MEHLVNQYEIKHKLGEGSFSTVFQGKNRKSKNVYAIKHINKAKATPENYENEVKVMKVLKKSPFKSIVQLKEIFEDEEDLFLVEEFIPNGDLLAYITKNKATLKEEDAKKLFWSILSAIEHLHKLGIAHRDIKLENVMLNEKEEIKIVDFNLSSFFTKNELLTKYCGSVFYCAPEILKRTPYNGERIDIWSLGVLLYVLLFFRFPFDITRKEEESERKEIVKKKILKSKFTFPEKPSISIEAKNLITWILNEDANLRPSAAVIKQHPWFSSLREKERENRRSFLFDVPRLVRSQSHLRSSLSPSLFPSSHTSTHTSAQPSAPPPSSPPNPLSPGGSQMEFETSDSDDENLEERERRNYSLHKIPVHLPPSLPPSSSPPSHPPPDVKQKNFLFKNLIN